MEINRTSVIPLITSDKNSEIVKLKLKEFEDKLKESLVIVLKALSQ
jgi:hypothetical protein